MRAIEIRKQNNILTIAFPPLANGIFGFDNNAAIDEIFY